MQAGRRAGWQVSVGARLRVRICGYVRCVCVCVCVDVDVDVSAGARYRAPKRTGSFSAKAAGAEEKNLQQSPAGQGKRGNGF